MIVIEHHTGLLSVCDQLVELGPTGGVGGGRVIATGTPKELIASKESITGPYLAAESGTAKKTKARSSGSSRSKKSAKKKRSNSKSSKASKAIGGGAS